MEQKVFERLRQVIYKESGISLSSEKKQLLQNRIQKRIRALKFQNERQYLDLIELHDVDGSELVHLIDAISTNLTFFFRERPHFDLFEKLLKQWDQEKRGEIKCWCAAASSGEEPYSIAITAAECLHPNRASLKLLASDICTTVLNKALHGVYEPQQLKDVPNEIKQKYFDRIQIENQTNFRVKSQLSKSILFKKLNLSRFPYPLKGPFDLIFCRNVMIYFDNGLRTQLVENFTKLLKPGGYLFVGHAESLSNIEHQLESVQTAVYRRRLK
ncbi:MAG: protein-glutamate O-methyltransferase CheR [Bdellovibrionales bacterium]|nr:protein-glutamate O-methyltransferase CheR [Bdellovibrionales bacterium]